MFEVTFAENEHNSWSLFGSFCASFFFSIFSMRTCERREAERVRCVVEAAPQARPEDHLGGIFCSSFVAEYHMGLASALQHCEHNAAFRVLAAQVFIDFGVILGLLSTRFLSSRSLKFNFFSGLSPGHVLFRLRIPNFARKGLQKSTFH